MISFRWLHILLSVATLMSTQADLNTYPWQFVLYYCNIVNADPTVYHTDLSNVCTLSFDANDNIAISNWLIGAYPAPSTATLLTYVLATVLTAYNNFYVIPDAIGQYQPYSISTADLANIRADASMLGWTIFNTTTHKICSWNGVAWVPMDSQFLPTVGGTMTGPINMGGQAITNTSSIVQSAPSGVSASTSASSSINMTANTGRTVPLGSFTVTSNPASDFTFDTTTGKATYTGSATRRFRVDMMYSITTIVPLTTQTLSVFISKNSSATLAGSRNVWTFIALGTVVTLPCCVSDTVQLATNDTVQLAALYTATAGVTFRDISVAISQI